LAELLVSLVGLIFSAPILGLSALAIVVTSPGPVFFRQERVGRRGHIFTLYKLRTMHTSQRGIEVTAKNDPRVTSVGRLLRMTKIDELPELWNVVKGEMSLVGPRPEVPRYVNLSKPDWSCVLCAKPGITDSVTLRLRNEELLLARIEGDRESFYLNTLQPFKLAGYIDYLQTRSCWTDIKILLKTVVTVLLPAHADSPTVEEITSYPPQNSVTSGRSK
jgi:lipopolysaccharide/colanic/teichoic acid biosynthesis glycosyltransferase